MQDGGNDYSVELAAPDIEPYRSGNTGIDYITRLRGLAPGPHLMISAVVHGNELCGAITLDYLFRHDIRPERGTLSLAFMNVDAFNSFDPEAPNLSRFIDEDFNRLWSPAVLDDSSLTSVELRRAREVRPYLDDVDFLLDIHSMQHATPPMMMAGPLSKGRALARQIGVPALVVSDSGHAAGSRMRDYNAFADASSEKNAVLVECGQHWETTSGQVALETAFRFLLALGAIGEEVAAKHLGGPMPVVQRFVEVTEPVTIKTDEFRFARDYRGLEVIERAGTVIAYDGDDPVTTPYDQCVLIMPSLRLNKGASAVRLGRYVGEPA